MAFCCFSLTTSLHPTHASTSRLSTGLAAFGENAPSNPQQHRITFCCFSLTTNSHPTHASTGTLSAGFMRHSLLAQARAGDGTMHHSVLTREAAQRSHISCAALIDRESNRAISSIQNGCDLVAAKRRQLHVVVGRQSTYCFTSGWQ